jgi:DNA-binding IclR family transcriptional regulator
VATRVSTKSLPGAAAGPDKLAAGGSASRVQSVDRAARLLRAVAAAGSQGAGTVALAEACALNRATAWRILSTLETHDLVRNARDAGVWTIGAGAFSLVRSAGHEALLHESHEVVERLALQTGETAALAVRRNGGLAYVDEVAPPSVVAAPWGNQPVSLHATSTGKVLLAWTSEEDVARLLPKRLERFTDSTITGRAALRAELDRVRRQGYATCDGEFDPAACGVSAPVLDGAGRLLAIVSVWGPPPRVAPDRFPALGALTMEAAARMAPL